MPELCFHATPCCMSLAQVEGANATDGRGPSIWDAFEAVPGNIFNNETSEWGQQLSLYYRAACMRRLDVWHAM